jgi:hypothetical protein
MLTRKLLKTSLCVAALGWGAARLYGEVMFVPNPSADCADGTCVPRRVTNGYFQTKWRKWPVEPPARPEPGVRPGIPAPPVEIPDPTEEIRLPSGSIIAPGPAPDQGPPPATDSAPRNGPLAPPAGRGAPEAAPRPDLPPALRNEIPPPAFDEQGSRLPPDNRSPRRIPTIASGSRNRPAAMLEASGAEGQWKPAEEGAPAASSRVPGVLPRDEMRNAEPLRKPSTDPAPHRPGSDSTDNSAARPPFSRDAFAYSNERAGWIEQFSPAGHGHGWTASDAANDHAAEPATNLTSDESSDTQVAAPRRAVPASTRLGARLSALRESTSESDDGAGWSAGEPEQEETDGPALHQSPSRTSQSSLRMSPAGLNTPAALGARDASAGVRRASAVADLTISTSDSQAILAVRTVGDNGWNESAPAGNPLRGGSRITRVAFESAEPPQYKTAEPASTSEVSTADFTVPTNPLR